MSSSSADNDSGGEEETVNGDTGLAGAQTNDSGTRDAEEPRILELLQEERDAAPVISLPFGDNPYKAAAQIEDEVEDRSAEATPRRSRSPIGSLLSIPDDTPSVHVG